MKSPFPFAGLGHEIAHFWTQGAVGPAASFLREGWAVWAESIILASEFGPETVKDFWKQRAATYLFGYDGKASLLEDESNSGVAYVKGPWLFHMLEDAMGGDGFQKAMTEYSRRTFTQPAGWETLAECVQRYASPNFDARAFLLPWLAGKSAPHLTAQPDGRRVTIRQEPAGGGRGVHRARRRAASHLDQGARNHRYLFWLSVGRANRSGWISAPAPLIGVRRSASMSRSIPSRIARAITSPFSFVASVGSP
jgi:hypothetical protein